MNSEQQIRAAAVQAAATCAVVIDEGDPVSVLKIAGLMEVYIRTGEEAALRHIQGWKSSPDIPLTPYAPGPEKASGDDGTGTQSDQGSPVPEPGTEEEYPALDTPAFAAQLLANEAMAADARADIKKIGERAEADDLMNQDVTVGDVTGTLRQCLNARWTALPKEKKPTKNPDLGL